MKQVNIYLINIQKHVSRGDRLQPPVTQIRVINNECMDGNIIFPFKHCLHVSL